MKVKQRLNEYLTSTYRSYNKLSTNRKTLLIKYNSLLDTKFSENVFMKDSMERENLIKMFKVNRFIDGFVKYKVDTDRLAYLANTKSLDDGGVISTLFKIVRAKLTSLRVRRDIKKLRMLIWEMSKVAVTKNDLEDYITNRFLKPDTETYQKNVQIVSRPKYIDIISAIGEIENKTNY